VSDVIRLKTVCVYRIIEFVEHKFNIDRLDLTGFRSPRSEEIFKKGKFHVSYCYKADD